MQSSKIETDAEALARLAQECGRLQGQVDRLKEELEAHNSDVARLGRDFHGFFVPYSFDGDDAALQAFGGEIRAIFIGGSAIEAGCFSDKEMARAYDAYQSYAERLAA